jgi:hypothetical protein
MIGDFRLALAFGSRGCVPRDIDAYGVFSVIRSAVLISSFAGLHYGGIHRVANGHST